jgi:coenzyme PQQ precursor peptide PqqA
MKRFNLCNVAAQLIVHCTHTLCVTLHIVMTKLLANLWAGIRVVVMQYLTADKREMDMAWKAPKIVEVAVGMEINMYACAARK